MSQQREIHEDEIKQQQINESITNITCAALLWKEFASDREMVDHMNNNNIPNQQYIQSTDECLRFMNYINISKKIDPEISDLENEGDKIHLALCKIHIQKFVIIDAAKSELINLYCNVWTRQHAHNHALIQEYQ
eukprot:454260_1